LIKDRKKVSNNGLTLPLVEEFYTIQGEGFHTGKAAWFIRLGGCDVGCSWCDSRFSWDSSFHPLVDTELLIENAFNSGTDSVVITGGEPLMWNLDYLCSGLKQHNLKTFIETSGAYPLSGTWDWICLSPKANMPPSKSICSAADELKVIIETKSDFEWAEENKKMVNNNCHLYLQPEWRRFENITPVIIEYVKRNVEWSISLQSHKFMHIP
jgi:7-carboxy-7-deazaguanine synthase